MGNIHNKHYPAEIFGYPAENKSKKAMDTRKNYLCPFNGNTTCSKQSRLLDYPMGICSTWWPSNSPIAICPKRVLQDKIIFTSIAKHIFGATDNILLFQEVKLKRVGTFDFVLLKHKPLSNEIEDFCVVEFQTDSTTGTGKLVNALKDYMAGKDITNNSYAFGMNTYNTIKLAFVQMLNKGQVFEAWDKKIVWVVQKYVYKNMVDRFGLQNMELNRKDANVFFIYDIDYQTGLNRYLLSIEKTRSSTIENLMKAFRSSELPKLDDFVKILHKKLKLNLGIKV
jgi:hypothetical protein